MGNEVADYRKRAMIERRRASIATRVAAIHLELADQYDALFDRTRSDPSSEIFKPKLVWSQGDEMVKRMASQAEK